jgi:DNA-binding NarL/FixJ family response regulator
MIRVIIADDHKLVRDGLKSLLAQAAADMQVVGEAANGREVLALLEKVEADVVLMDVDMPELNGIETTRHLARQFPGAKVLMLTMADNEQWVLESVQAGAQGYLLKSAGRKELLTAIRTVAQGEEHFSTDLTKMLLQKVQAAGKGSSAPVPPPVPGVNAPPPGSPVPMSPRELEVLRLIAKGHTNHQIAEVLFTSRRTVETHRQNLLEKTGTNNTATLVLYAASNGLLE